MKKKKLFNILIAVLAGLLIVGLLIGIIYNFTKNDDDESTVNLSWSYGSLSSTGTYVEGEGSIYSNAFDCYGLKVVRDFESTDITYSIYFYDFEDDYLSSLTGLTTDYKSEVPLAAKTCRLVITPVDDDSISFFEKNSYAKKLTVTVSSNQPDLLDKISNLTDVAEVEGIGVISEGAYLESSQSPWYVTKAIDVTNASTVYMLVATSSLTGTVTYDNKERDCLYLYIDGENSTSNTVVYTDSDISYISIDVSSGSKFIACVDADTVAVLQMYVV